MKGIHTSVRLNKIRIIKRYLINFCDLTRVNLERITNRFIISSLLIKMKAIEGALSNSFCYEQMFRS